MESSAETRHVIFWEAEGILFGEYAEGAVIDLAAAMEAVEARIRFSEGKSYPCLFDMRKLRSVSKEARVYLANEGAKYITAAALVTGSLYTNTLANVFLIINKPPVTTRLFENIPDAKKWLMQFIPPQKMT